LRWWAIGQAQNKKLAQQQPTVYSLLKRASGRDDFLGYRPFSANPRISQSPVRPTCSRQQPYPYPRHPARLMPAITHRASERERLNELLDNDQQFDSGALQDMQLGYRPPPKALGDDLTMPWPCSRRDCSAKTCNPPLIDVSRDSARLGIGTFTAEQVRRKPLFSAAGRTNLMRGAVR